MAVRLAIVLIALVAAAQAHGADAFNWAPRGPLEGDWQTESGAWSGSGVSVLSESEGVNVLSCISCPDSNEAALHARVTPLRRQGAGDWAAAGIALFEDMQDYWRLALVQGPDGKPYAELVEMLGGVWQAQSTPGTRLQGSTEGDGLWQYGRRYEMAISLSGGAITGEVSDADTGSRLFRARYPVAGEVAALSMGRLALSAVDMKARFEGISASGTRLTLRPRGQRRAAVVGGLPGERPALTRMVAERIERRGLPAAVVAAEDLAHELNADRFDVLVIPWAERFPAEARRPLLRFMQAGGRLLVLGKPPFERWVIRSDGGWQSAQDVMASVRAAHPLVDFGREDLSEWTRATDNPSAGANREVVQSPHGAALRVRIDRLTGWDTVESPAFARPFPAGDSLTCFWAKGSRNTRGLIVEWREKDGSRWIATVSLTEEWKHFALAPRDFAYWRDSPAKNRGGPGDALNPAAAERLSIGLAHSHLAIAAAGPHEYSIAALGTAPDPTAGLDVSPLVMEALSPWFKGYDVSATGLRGVASGRVVSLKQAAWCCIPRSKSLTFSRQPPGRWIPILEALHPGGDGAGACGWAYFPLSGPYRISAWACVAVGDSAWAERNLDRIAPAMDAAIDRLGRDVLLTRAGAKEWCYFPGEQAGFAGEVRNLGAGSRAVTVRWSVFRGKEQVFAASSQLTIEAGGVRSAESGPWKPGAAGIYRVSTTISGPGGISDALEHELRVLPERTRGEFVAVRDGRFSLAGKQWHAHGINYWPRYIAGLPWQQYSAHWLTPAFYDPVEVEKDLELLEKLGVNAVSVQFTARDQARPLNDFLARAIEHGIRANVFLAGAHPLHTDEGMVTDLISQARLADNRAIFAYDIAWEPALGRYEARRALNKEWNRWIEEQYGSLDNAAADWGFEPQMLDGVADGPTDDQLREDGPWRVMVAAYRRFADDLISRRYGRVTRLIRGLDPNHLIGARTGYGGTGQPGVVPAFPYDLVSGARHLDFVSPEGWGLSGPWPEFRLGGFTTAYGRWAGNGKPVFWAEFGATIYPGTSRRKIAEQARIYQHMYRMVLESGADGSAGWWFPGGLRIDENSDYGMVNPDGTFRPAATAVRAFGPRIKASRPQRPTIRIEIDRDLHVTGYAGVWGQAKAAYLSAIEAGRRVIVKTEATGKTTADMPLVTVGNLPYNRRGPLKYADAEFDFLRIRNAEGRWQDVEDSGVVGVKGGSPVLVWAGVGNTGEAKWLAPQGSRPGAVYISAVGGGIQARKPVQNDVPRYGAAEVGPFPMPQPNEEIEISFRMEIEGLGRFGEERRVRLAPVK